MDHTPHFTEVYDAYIRQIYAYCLRRTSSAEAQDAAADVFMVVWRRWEDRPFDDELLPWIYGIARNVLANRHRSIRRRARLARKLIGLRSAQDPGPEAAAVLRSEHHDVLQALSKLTANDQETLRLVEWEGLTRDQVARLFGISRSAIDQRISRAYRRLEKALTTEQSPTLSNRPASGEHL